MIPALNSQQVARVRDFEAMAAGMPQVAIPTQHCFHAGLYERTVMIPAGVVICGALIKIDTVVIVSGDCSIATGNGVERVTGYKVMPAAAGRKQVFYAHADTWITMQFATTAATVEDAEAEFTDETDRLASRHGENIFE